VSPDPQHNLTERPPEPFPFPTSTILPAGILSSPSNRRRTGPDASETFPLESRTETKRAFTVEPDPDDSRESSVVTAVNPTTVAGGSPAQGASARMARMACPPEKKAVAAITRLAMRFAPAGPGKQASPHTRNGPRPMLEAAPRTTNAASPARQREPAIGRRGREDANRGIRGKR